jgi:hypothetical protein
MLRTAMMMHAAVYVASSSIKKLYAANYSREKILISISSEISERKMVPLYYLLNSDGTNSTNLSPTTLALVGYDISLIKVRAMGCH